jgi:hypothetical protein
MVGVSLWLKQIPSAVLIGFPAALWLALSGGDTIARKRGAARRSSKADKEGDRA